MLLAVPSSLVHAAEPGNDANSGTDAPDDSSAWIEVAPGTYNGTLDWNASDPEDWYRVTLPQGSGIEVDVTAFSGAFYAGLYADDPSRALYAQGHAVAGSTIHLSAGHESVLIGIGDREGNGSASYGFTVIQTDLSGQDDAGSHRDASADWPVNVGPGSYTGHVDPAAGDSKDWFGVRSATPANLRIEGDVIVEIRGVEARTPVDVINSTGVDFAIRALDGAGPTDYSFSFILLPHAHVTMSPIVIGRPASTAPLAFNTARFTVTSDGDLPAVGYLSFQAPSSLIVSTITQAPYSLDPGHSLDCTATFGTEGDVGQLRVSAGASVHGDPFDGAGGSATFWIGTSLLAGVAPPQTTSATLDCR